MLPTGARLIVAERKAYFDDRSLDGLWDDPREAVAAPAFQSGPQAVPVQAALPPEVVVVGRSRQAFETAMTPSAMQRRNTRKPASPPRRSRKAKRARRRCAAGTPTNGSTTKFQSRKRDSA